MEFRQEAEDGGWKGGLSFSFSPVMRARSGRQLELGAAAEVVHGPQGRVMAGGHYWGPVNKRRFLGGTLSPRLSRDVARFRVVSVSEAARSTQLLPMNPRSRSVQILI